MRILLIKGKESSKLNWPCDKTKDKDLSDINQKNTFNVPKLLKNAFRLETLIEFN